MRFSTIGNRTIAYASFAYLWYLAMSTISSIIGMISTTIGYTTGIKDFFSMMLPSVSSIVITTFIQLVIVYLIFNFYSSQHDDEFNYNVAFLFAGVLIGLSALTQLIYMPFAFLELIWLLIRGDIYRSGQQVYLIGQLMSMILEFSVAVLLINRSRLKLANDLEN